MYRNNLLCLVVLSDPSNICNFNIDVPLNAQKFEKGDEEQQNNLYFEFSSVSYKFDVTLIV